MAKTVLTLDEINLLKNSEEPKDYNARNWRANKTYVPTSINLQKVL